MLAALAEIFCLVACSETPPHSGATPLGIVPLARNEDHSFAISPSSGLIKYVIFIVQENRSTDNLFNGLPGANTVTSGLNSSGQTVPLQPVDLTANYDPGHNHVNYTAEYNAGGMNGFDKDAFVPGSACIAAHDCPPQSTMAYAYVPQSEVQPYFTMAETYAFADEFFQTNQGPSFAAHQYLISGTSATTAAATLEAMDIPLSPTREATGGCDSPTGSLVSLINPLTNDQTQSTYPCFDHETLMDLLDGKGLTWTYYQTKLGPGIWFAPDAISHIRDNPADYANVSAPATNIFTDITNGNLKNVSWVIPTGAESDHSGGNDGTGPSWVASVVNAIGNSQYWNQCVIFVTWDDWGGWYDHVAPVQRNYYELGMRVPLIAISPYAKTGYVSHKQTDFGSLLKFVESTFGLRSLGYADKLSNPILDVFNFKQTPRPFQTITAEHNASFFIHQLPDTRPPDSE